MAGGEAPLSFNAWLRYDTVLRMLRSVPEASTFLEIGCGQGAFGTRLAIDYDYLGFEPDEASCRVADERLAAVGAGRVVNSPLPREPLGQFDLVGAFEVLEHLEDDAAALAQWADWVRPGGRLVLSVPAHPHRFGPWDVEVGHYRRYDRRSLAALLVACGFEPPEIRIYGFPLGYLLEAARNRFAGDEEELSVEERTARSGRRLQPAAGLGWMPRVATVPFRWMQRPFAQTELGTGYVALAERPS
ncbi:MAG: methyltransferase domain-containing protein [Acidimicrobiia bacterium]